MLLSLEKKVETCKKMHRKGRKTSFSMQIFTTFAVQKRKKNFFFCTLKYKKCYGKGKSIIAIWEYTSFNCNP